VSAGHSANTSSLSRGERAALRLARAALRASPRTFREAFGDELLDVFSARYREERRRGRLAALALVARTQLDLLATAAIEHWNELRAARSSLPGPLRREENERMDRLLKDLVFAARVLRASPAHTSAAVLTIALGIGANVAIFSLVDALLLRPLPGIPEPGRVVVLFTEDGGSAGVSSYLDVQDLAQATTTLSGLASYKPLAIDLSAGGETERVDGMLVTASYFPTLQVDPAVGRFFLDEEDRPPAQSPVAVLGWGLWQRRFGGAEIVGDEVVLNGRSFTVIGIASPDFRGTYLGSRPELFVPMAMQPVFMPTSGYLLDRRGWGGVGGVGRLSESATLEEARAEIATLGAQLRAEYREAAEREYLLSPLRQGSLMPAMRSQAVGLSALLLVVVALVLLAACANVANLLLSRSTARRRELAVRGALGAGRRRLVAQLLTESAVLAALGGVAGLGIAAALLPPLRRLPLPFALDLALDGRVLAFAFVVTLGSVLVFGLLPALRATRNTPEIDLRGGAAATARPRLALALVVTQIGVSLLLAVLAGLLGRTLVALGSTELGFRQRDVAMAVVDPALQGYDGPATAAFYEALVERVRALPGVAAAGLVSLPPGTSDRDVSGFFPPGRAVAARRMSMQFSVADAGYFETLGLALLSGRLIEPGDGATSRPVVVLNESAAALVTRSLERPALGALLWTGGDDEPELEVVGVVADSKTGMVRDAPAPMVYFALPQAAAAGLASRMTLLARGEQEPAALLPELRRAVREIDPHVPVIGSGTLDSHLAAALVRERLSASVLGGAAATALLLAAVGLYGVLGTAVSRRTAELGLRMALGARGADLVRMVVAQGLGLYVVGLVLGLLGAVFASRLVGSQLYGVPPVDPATYGAAALVLGAVTAVASWLPARRATRIDPVRALRED
jgi:predicted permease